MNRQAQVAQPSPAADFRAGLVEHWKPVFRLLYRLTHDPHESEELAQETMVRAMERRESFQAGSNLRAWLMRIATNAFLDQCRRKKVLRFGPLEESSALDRPDNDAPPSSPMELREIGDAVAAAVAQLDPTPRAVFLLRVQEEMEYSQIAEAVGLSEGAARWHMMQARRDLMVKLDGKLDEFHK